MKMTGEKIYFQRNGTYWYVYCIGIQLAQSWFMYMFLVARSIKKGEKNLSHFSTALFSTYAMRKILNMHEFSFGVHFASSPLGSVCVCVCC